MSLIKNASGQISYFGNNSESIDRIDPGWYDVVVPMGPPFVKKKESHLNERYVFDTTSSYHFLRSEMQKFLAARDAYRTMGIVHRRGYIMHGPPGTGKTAIMKSLEADFVKAGGIVIGGELFNQSARELVKGIVRVCKCPVMCAVDEIDQVIRSYGDGAVAEVLDASWMGFDRDETLFVIGTTNNITRMSTKFTQRPGRFDRVIEVAKMDMEALRMITKNLGIENHVDEIYKKFRGLITPASCTEIATRINVFSYSLADAMKDIPSVNSKSIDDNIATQIAKYDEDEDEDDGECHEECCEPKQD